MKNGTWAKPESPSPCSSIPLQHTHRRCEEVQVSVGQKKTYMDSTELGFAGPCHAQQTETAGGSETE